MLAGLAPGTPLNWVQPPQPLLESAAERLVIGMSLACGLLLITCLVFTCWTQGWLDAVPVTEAEEDLKVGSPRLVKDGRGWFDAEEESS